MCPVKGHKFCNAFSFPAPFFAVGSYFASVSFLGPIHFLMTWIEAAVNWRLLDVRVGAKLAGAVCPGISLIGRGNYRGSRRPV